MNDGAAIERITAPRDIELMTDWMYSWWGRAENYSREAVKSCLEHSLNTTRLPQTFGLYVGGRLAGMYQFTNSDLFPRPDIYPWLANVFVDPQFRGRGYGRLLLSSVKRNAAEAGLCELYLFTAHSGLYEKFGWEFVGPVETFLEPGRQRLYRLAVPPR